MSLDTSAIIAELFDSSIIGDIECFIKAINFATKPNFFWVKKIKKLRRHDNLRFPTNNYSLQLKYTIICIKANAIGETVTIIITI